jgi:hypothetical protein
MSWPLWRLSAAFLHLILATVKNTEDFVARRKPEVIQHRGKKRFAGRNPRGRFTTNQATVRLIVQQRQEAAGKVSRA